jgi:hypothetical protein
MRGVLAIFVVTRIVLVITVLGALAAFTPAACDFCVATSANPLLAGLARWDGAAYLDIARDGYAGAGREGLAAYFPLYPLLMHLGGALLGGSTDAYLVVGVVIANAALLVSVIALARLAATLLGPAGATRASAYLLVFPTTIFLSAVYADSLFLALAIASAIAARNERWMAAGWLAAGAAVTRPFGGVALLPLAIAYWRARRRAPARSAIALLFAPGAFAAWIAFLAITTGDPLALLHGYTSGFEPRHPLQAFTDLFDPSVYGFPWFVGGLFVLVVALVVRSWRVAGAELAAYATAMLVVIAAAGSLASSPRYELSIYPAFIALASLSRSRAAVVVWIVASALLAILFTAMFALYFWVG